MRKHGGSIAAVLEHAERARARRDELAGAEVALEATSEALRRGRGGAAGARARAALGAREAAVPALERGVREQLAALAMADATLRGRAQRARRRARGRRLASSS